MVSELEDVFEHSASLLLQICRHHCCRDVGSQSKDARNSANVRVAKIVSRELHREKSPPEGISIYWLTRLFMYSEDPVTAAKISVEFAKTNENLKIVGGAMGDKILDTNGVTEVSKLPSREEVLSSISALLTAPGGNLTANFNGPASAIAGVLENIGGN